MAVKEYVVAAEDEALIRHVAPHFYSRMQHPEPSGVEVLVLQYHFIT